MRSGPSHLSSAFVYSSNVANKERLDVCKIDCYICFPNNFANRYRVLVFYEGWIIGVSNARIGTTCQSIGTIDACYQSIVDEIVKAKVVDILLSPKVIHVANTT